MERYLKDNGIKILNGKISKAEVSIAKDILNKYTPEIDNLYKELEKAEKEYENIQKEMHEISIKDVSAWHKIQDILGKIRSLTGVAVQSYISVANVAERFEVYPEIVECEKCLEETDTIEMIEQEDGKMFCRKCSNSATSSEDGKDRELEDFINKEYYIKYKNQHERMMKALESLKKRLSYFPNPLEYDSGWDYKEEYNTTFEIIKKLKDI